MSQADEQLTSDDIAARAVERAELDDFGPPEWREGLDLLLAELNGDDRVTADGYAGITGGYVGLLWNRLRVVDYAKQHPEVRDGAIVSPLVIGGMPRTGTTVASYLLAEDPAHRSLLNWEATDLIPPATTETLKTDPRCVEKRERQEQMRAMMIENKIAPPHWEAADGPTECIFVQAQDFKALSLESSQPTDVYSDWLTACDMTSAYEYEKLVLQILQSKAPGRWSLKMPSHAMHVETLFKVFPDTKMIVAHRDPYKATGSLCSTVAMGHRQAGFIDPEAIGKVSVKQMKAHVERPMRLRDRIGEDQFFDLYYSRVMRDPIGQMRELYEWAGEDLSPEIEQRMQQWLAGNPPDLFGPRPYSLDEYGLTKDELVPVFEEYLNRYDIELEGQA
ncbi:MAG: sulfotransferase family protein [Acidimicrobiia bacterium]